MMQALHVEGDAANVYTIYVSSTFTAAFHVSTILQLMFGVNRARVGVNRWKFPVLGKFRVLLVLMLEE